MKPLLFLLLFLPVFVDAQIITTVAGNGSAGSSGDGGMATDAAINPRYCAIDANGNIYFTESYPYTVVRKLDLAGIITTIAGSDSAGGGFYGDGLQATVALLSGISGIATDGANNIYIADAGNGRVRKVNAATGIITTVAGNGTTSGPWLVSGVTATATNITGLFGTFDICVDKRGNLYIANYLQVARVDTAGILTWFAGDTTSGRTTPETITTPKPATAAKLGGLTSICADPSGNIYLGYFATPDHWHYSLAAILIIDTNGIVSRYAGTGIAGESGDGGPATNGKIAVMFGGGIKTDESGSLYFTSGWYPTVRRVDASGMLCTVAGGYHSGYSGDGGPATAATLDQPNGVACDVSGDIYIVDYSNHRIRKVTHPECSFLESAVADILPQSTINVYPNPATKLLMISANEIINSVSISNVLGKVLQELPCRSKTVEIDISKLPKGFYLVRINGTEARKFVKE
jgi:trimeric autotransporter adhesin